jgi:hypothetical protein
VAGTLGAGLVNPGDAAGAGVGGEPQRIATKLELGFSVDARESPRALAIDDEDSLFVVGSGLDADSEQDWWLKKFDATGHENTTEWSKDTVSQDVPSALAVDASGDVFVAGTTANGWWLKRFDALGVEDALQWNKLIDAKFLTDAGLDLERVSGAPERMATDSKGSVYLVGAAKLLVQSDLARDAWLVLKFSATGELSWGKAFDGGHAWPGADWPYNATPHSVALDSQDNVYVVGQIRETGWWLKKLSSAGADDTVGWNQHFDLGYGAAATSVTVDALDRVYVRGSDRTYVNQQIADLPWPCRRFGNDGVEDVAWHEDSGRGPGIAVTARGDLYLPGTTELPDTLALEKLGAQGASLATLLIPDEPHGYLVDYAVDSNDRVYVITDRGLCAFR